MLSDDDLRSLSRDDLDDLRGRLAHAAGDMPSLTAGNQRRRRFVVEPTTGTRLSTDHGTISQPTLCPGHAGRWKP